MWYIVGLKPWAGPAATEGTNSMLALFEKTWVLWWMLAVLVILRWFHVLSAGAPRDPYEFPEHDSDECTTPGQLASRT